MWKLPDWYGSSIVALLVATLLSLWADDPSYSYLFGLLLNVNALVLLVAWEYLPPHCAYNEPAITNNTVEATSSNDDRALPLLEVEAKIDNQNNKIHSTLSSADDEDDDRYQIPSVQISSLSVDSYDDERYHRNYSQKKPSSSAPAPINLSKFTRSSSASSSWIAGLFATAPKILSRERSHHSDDNDDDEDDGENDDDSDDELIFDFERSFFCWGFVCQYTSFFALVLLVSTWTFLQSCFETSPSFDIEDGNDTTNYFYVTNYYYNSSWKHGAFSLSFGALLAACLVFYGKSILQRFVSPAPFGMTPNIMYALGVLMYVVLVVGVWIAESREWSQQRQFVDQRDSAFDPLFGETTDEYGSNITTSSASSSLFLGEAWTIGNATILESSSSTYCFSSMDVIPVSISVVWGGDWACPSSSDEYCQATIEAQVSCLHWSTYQQQTYVDDDATLNTVTLDDYLQFRYHDYGIDDDTAYDRDEEPLYSYWNRPTERIVGTCDGTCQAQSQAVLSQVQDQVTVATHLGFAGIGIGMIVSVLPLYELWVGYWKHKNVGQGVEGTTSVPNGENGAMPVVLGASTTDYQREMA